MSSNTIQHISNVDEKTGLPADYESFFAAYRPLILSAADRLHIPFQDREDATQEVQIKFWLKNGLDMYDSSRNTKFATLLRNWASMFLMQERDKVKKNGRNQYRDPLDWALEIDGFGNTTHKTEEFTPEVLTAHFVNSWVDDAEKALEEANKIHLVPVLKLCVRAAEEGKAPTRAQIAEAAQVAISRATPYLKDLRETLAQAGLGVESLYG